MGLSLTNLTDHTVWQPFREPFIDQYPKKLFWSSPLFLSPERVNTLLSWAKECESYGLMKPAAVGKGVLKKRAADIRTDKICWIEDFSSKQSHLVREIFEGLQLIARQDFYLSAKRFECHFAKYEKGNFYKLHRDRHKQKPGRLLTCVIYLTDCKESDGGQLSLYDENANKVVIQPESGKIVVFDSALKHEVTKSLADRWSLTGWIRSDFHPGIRL